MGDHAVNQRPVAPTYIPGNQRLDLHPRRHMLGAFSAKTAV